MQNWSYLVEARDVNIRELELQARRGTPEAVIQYLVALKRHGDQEDLRNKLDILLIPDKNLIRLMVMLRKTESFDLILNPEYPFVRRPQSVQIIARMLNVVHDKRVAGFKWKPFYKHVRSWLLRNAHISVGDVGRQLDNYLWGSNLQSQTEMNPIVDGEVYAIRYYTLPIPSNDHITTYNIGFAALIEICDNVDGGAVGVQVGFGQIATELYPNTAGVDDGWAEVGYDIDNMVEDARHGALLEFARHLNTSVENLDDMLANNRTLRVMDWRAWDVDDFRRALAVMKETSLRRFVRLVDAHESQKWVKAFNVETIEDVAALLSSAIDNGYLPYSWSRWTTGMLDNLSDRNG